MEIRSCRPDECDVVLDLWSRADARPTPTDELEELQRLARDHGDLFLVAEEDSEIVGSVIAGWDGWRGHIYRIVVDPRARRNGVATALVGEAITRLKGKGARRLSALVVTEDSHSIDFWDSLGELGFEPDPWPKSRYVTSY